MDERKVVSTRMGGDEWGESSEDNTGRESFSRRNSNATKPNWAPLDYRQNRVRDFVDD